MQHLWWLLPVSVYSDLNVTIWFQEWAVMTSPGNLLEMQNLRPHLRHPESEFSHLWVPQVVHLHIKDRETFFEYIPSHYLSTNSEKILFGYLDRVSRTHWTCASFLIFALLWLGEETILFLLLCSIMVIVSFIPFNNFWRPV